MREANGRLIASIVGNPPRQSLAHRLLKTHQPAGVLPVSWERQTMSQVFRGQAIRTASPADSLVHAGQRIGADRREVRARLEVRRPGGALLRRHRQGLLQGRRPQRHDRLRPRLGRRHRPRRRRHLSDRLLRHQFAGQVPGPEPRQEGPGGADGLRQAAVRHRQRHQDRHQQAEGPGRQGARRAAARRRLRAMEGVREGEQHRRLQGEDRE